MKEPLSPNMESKSDKYSHSESETPWEDVKENQRICVNLFRQIATDNLGYYRPCCKFRDSVIGGDGSDLHMSNMSPENFLNSEPMVKVRADALAGKKVKGCELCYKDEEDGVESMRQRDNKTHQKRHKSINLNLKQKDVTKYDMRLGSLCNLGCVMCTPVASSHLNAVWSNNGGWAKFSKSSRTYDGLSNRFDIVNWYKNDREIANVAKLCSNLERLMIVGGEPMINKYNLDFLKALEHQGKQLEVEISSNITILNKEMLRILAKMNTEFKCSIDATGKLYDYIRHPASFKEVEKNLIALAEYDMRIQVVFTTSVLNIFNIPDFYNWILEVREKMNKNISFSISNVVFQPDHLSIAHLPPNIKEQALEVLRGMNNALESKQDGSTVRQLINFLENSEGNPEVIRSGWKYLEQYDKVRNNSWKNHIPWMEAVLK